MIKNFQIDDYCVSFWTEDMCYVTKKDCIVTIFFKYNSEPIRLVVATPEVAQDIFDKIRRGY
jgi:hypothetical protein